LINLLQDLGFVDVKEIERFDSFGGSASEGTARAFDVEGANFFARIPENKSASDKKGV